MDSIAEALRLSGNQGADVDSDSLSRWVEVIPGVDLAGLEGNQREQFVRFANAQRCTCGCGYTLAACRVYDSTCEVSMPRVSALLDSVRMRLVGSTAGLRSRPLARLTLVGAGAKLNALSKREPRGAFRAP